MKRIASPIAIVLTLVLVFASLVHSVNTGRHAQVFDQHANFCLSLPMDEQAAHAMSQWVSYADPKPDRGHEHTVEHCPFCHLPVISNFNDGLARAFHSNALQGLIPVSWDLPSPRTISVQNASRAPPIASTSFYFQDS
jgi:hypothetical protein